MATPGETAARARPRGVERGYFFAQDASSRPHHSSIQFNSVQFSSVQVRSGALRTAIAVVPLPDKSSLGSDAPREILWSARPRQLTWLNVDKPDHEVMHAGGRSLQDRSKMPTGQLWKPGLWATQSRARNARLDGPCNGLEVLSALATICLKSRTPGLDRRQCGREKGLPGGRFSARGPVSVDGPVAW
jgi:hypothetical protein